MKRLLIPTLSQAVYDEYLYANFEVQKDFIHENESFVGEKEEAVLIPKGTIICRSAFTGSFILKVKPKGREQFFRLEILLSEPELFKLVKK